MNSGIATLSEKKVVSAQKKWFSRDRTRLWSSVLVLMALASAVTVPVSAGEKYMAGSPKISAYLAGTNEFSPGKDVQLQVVIQNTGTNEFKFVNSGIVDTEDLPNTAKSLVVSLNAGNAPVSIKSDPQMLGDVKASNSASAVFTVRVPSESPAGSYELQIQVNYTYLYTSDQTGLDTIQYFYKTRTETIPLPLKIKPTLTTDVLSAESQHLNAGTEGYITLIVKNTGHENATKSVLTIHRSGTSPIIPTESSVYIGNFPAGSTVECKFKASVEKGAEAQTYPLDVDVRYENRDGDLCVSGPETVGIFVGEKINFAIISGPESLNPGQKKVITVSYKNTGGATAYQARARLSMVDPFTSNDDTAFLGDIPPGESRDGSFLISTDNGATLKRYGIDSEIKYRDALENMVISDPLKVCLDVEADKGGLAGLMANPLLLGITAILVAAAGYGLYRKVKSR